MRPLFFFCVGHAMSCVVFAAAAQVFTEPIVPSNPEAAGKELATRLLALQPAASMTNHAILTIQTGKTNQLTLALQIEVSVAVDMWTTTYVLPATAGQHASRYTVMRSQDGSTKYQVSSDSPNASAWIEGQAGMVPIAGSDFTLADMGMEFLRWPNQRLVKKEIRRTQSCDKLESVAPDGWTNGYARVVSWFDIDTGGPVIVEAFDAKGRMVKEFRPTRFEKKDGQYEVEEIEINNLLTKSRSTLRFVLKPPTAKPFQAP